MSTRRSKAFAGAFTTGLDSLRSWHCSLVTYGVSHRLAWSAQAPRSTCRAVLTQFPMGLLHQQAAGPSIARPDPRSWSASSRSADLPGCALQKPCRFFSATPARGPWLCVTPASLALEYRQLNLHQFAHTFNSQRKLLSRCREPSSVLPQQRRLL